MSFEEDFEFYFQEEKADLAEYLRHCINDIHDKAVELGLEFDGYYRTNKELADDFLLELEDDYFTNEDRRVLYVLSAALCSDQIMDMLEEALKRTPYYPISKQAICTRINEFGRSGVVFLPSVLH